MLWERHINFEDVKVFDQANGTLKIFNLTTVYKAGLSTVRDLYNLVTKNITKYPVLVTFKILQNCKKNISNFFEKIFRHFVPQNFFKNWRFFYNFGEF